MNDNDVWPRMGQAAASRAAKVLADHASWQLTECAAYHGLPLAAFLHDEASALLVAAIDCALPPAAAAMTATLLETRSDAVIVGVETGQHGLPEIALGLWRQGVITWHQPLLPWMSEDGTMWLAPSAGEVDLRSPAFRLGARHLRGNVAPWACDEEREAGWARAATAFAAFKEAGEGRGNEQQHAAGKGKPVEERDE